MSDSTGILKKALDEIDQATTKGQRVVVVFDLDSTLFDVTPRLQKIIHQFAVVPEHIQKFPENCKLLLQAEAQHGDWGIKKALQRAGLDELHRDFQMAMREFWLKTFFSNEYLDFDVPYDGAVNFVNAVYSTGAEIVYLTGRDTPRQGPGTEKILHKWGFPLGKVRTELALKPKAGLDDALFKEEFMRKYDRETSVWLFENEPVNVNRIRRHHPHVKIIFLDTTHAGHEEPPEDIPQILHFVLHEEDK